jgi:hypothetical protein
MSDQEPDKKDEQQGPPSPDELQQRAQYVWKILKFFFSGVFLFALLLFGFLFFWLFHAFGISGVIIGAVILVAGLFLLCRHLLTY